MTTTPEAALEVAPEAGSELPAQRAKFAFDVTFRVIATGHDADDAEDVLQDLLGEPLLEDRVLFRQIHTVEELETCRVCGCTEDDGCEVGCSWVEQDLCSECANDVESSEEEEEEPECE